jgi:hypothetical protein
MSNPIYGYRNHLLNSQLSAGSQVPGLDIGQIQNDQGATSRAWQTGDGVLTSAAGAHFTATANQATWWQAFGLFRTNLSPVAQIRWRVGGPRFLDARTALLTDTAAGATQGVGTTRTGTVAGPSGAGGTAYTNTAGSAYVRPGMVAVSGGYKHELVVSLRRVSGTSTAGYAIIAEYLDAAGAVTRSRLPMTEVHQDTDWHAYVLKWAAPVDGNCTIYLMADTGPLQYELGPASFAQMPELDTGMMPAGVVPGYARTVLVQPTPVRGVLCRCDISDPTNPQGSLNIPLAYAGEGWSPEKNISWASAPGRDVQVDEVTTRGGQEYPSLRWRRQRMDIDHQSILADEVWPRIMDLQLAAEHGGNILFVPNPDSEALQCQALFGRLTSQSDVTHPFQSDERRAWRARLTERL